MRTISSQSWTKVAIYEVKQAQEYKPPHSSDPTYTFFLLSVSTYHKLHKTQNFSPHSHAFKPTNHHELPPSTGPILKGPNPHNPTPPSPRFQLNRPPNPRPRRRPHKRRTPLDAEHFPYLKAQQSRPLLRHVRNHHHRTVRLPLPTGLRSLRLHRFLPSRCGPRIHSLRNVGAGV